MRISLPDFALRRPVTVLMLSISFVALGAIAWYEIPLKFLPRVEDPFIGCQIIYPGATPEQAEQQLAIPAEGEFRTIPGMKYIRTHSGSNGVFVSMIFDPDTDMGTAAADVRDRMERLKLKLPPEVDRMILHRSKSSALPVMFIGLFRDGDLRDFVNRLEDLLQPALARVDGVANVQIFSPVPREEVIVEFDPDVLRGRSLSLASLVASLQQSSMNVSAGELEEGDKKYLVRVTGEYRKIRELKKLIVGPNGLRLQDIANVRYAARDEHDFISLDGQGGAVAFVTKESEANTVSTCRNLRKELERVLALPDFEGTTHVVFFDQAELIMGALDNLKQEGLYGAAMALIVLFTFLHRFRPTIIVALTIPSSLMVALVFMFLSGMTLNLITMVSLIISVGMLVDNAIVVVENIIRYHRMGYDMKESARRGASEVGLAIFAATATTWVVFIPIYYQGGGMFAIFMKQLGLPLVVALGGSLLIALTVVPLAMSRMRPRTGLGIFRLLRDRERGLFARIAGVRLIQRTIDGYARILDGCLGHRLGVVLLLAGLVWLTYSVPLGEKGIGQRGMPKLDRREVNIRVELEQNYDLAATSALFDRLETQVNQWRDELGIKRILNRHSATEGQFNIFLYADEDGALGANPPYTTDEVAAILSQRLPKLIPGGELRFEQTGSGETGQQSTVSLNMRGDDRKTLNQYAERLAEWLNTSEYLSEARADRERTTQEVQIKIDEELADQEGITATAIARTIDMALRGAQLPYMKQGSREVPVWAQFREEDRRRKESLDNVTIMGRSGELVPLTHLVDYTRAPAPATIQRIQGKNVVTITAKVNTPNLDLVMNDIDRILANFHLPVGYTINMGDEMKEMAETMSSFLVTLLMAVLLIYLVMSALFESYLLPLSILTSVPLALGGGVWMLYFMDSQLDPVTLIGCVLMTGLIVNNGIVIVDHINHLRKKLDSTRKAIVEAGRDRFRPVFMTAITTILGVIPLAMADTGGAATFAGLGQALIGGLTAGTILTLFIVPVFYSLIDGFQGWFFQFIGSFAQLRHPARRPG